METREGVGQGRNKQKRDPRGVTTDLGGGQGRNKQKRDSRGVTTDQGRGGRAGINKNVTHAGSQLTRGVGAGQE